ncbi:MAG: NUDIX domain-containing protein [Aggregatilineales bacterium]
MAGIGVNVAVMRDNKVLLIQREDFEVWGLPGGEIESGETPAQAAVREVLEETGLVVRLTRLVGLYTKPQWTIANSVNAAFAAEIVGGELRRRTEEAIAIGFFSKAELPQQLIWWSRRQVEDALDGIGGSAVWTQEVSWPADNPDRWELYRRRDESGLSRSEFFYRTFQAGRNIADVEGRTLK